MVELGASRVAAVFPASEIIAPGVRVRPIEGLAIASVSVRRGREAELDAALQNAFGNGLLLGPTFAQAGDVAFLGTGPGAWLAVATDGSLHVRLTRACEGLAAVSDQSGAYGVLALEGPAVRALLARAIALDLDPKVFAQASAAVCAFGHLGAVLWRAPGSDDFRLALSRSTSADGWRFIAHVAASLAACG